MKQRMRRSGAICAFVPDYIWRQVAKHGTAEERQRALANLAADHSLRMARLHTLLARLAGQTRGPSAVEPKGLVRAIADARHGYDAYDAPVVRKEGDPPGNDGAVNEAYNGLGATYRFYAQAYRRRSIDGKGLELDGVVHYGHNYDNAMWDGERMIFGDGDGRIFKRLTRGIDVIGHELTHGVTESTAGLYYYDQPGALNESVSDVFGSLVKQFTSQQTAQQADWLIGADVIGPAVLGKALRSMAQPGTAYRNMYGHKDPQPDHMKNYVTTTMDNGGVHINSGIPNRAFYLVATELGGFAWQRAGMIWYKTLRHSKLAPTATFKLFAAITLDVAEKLFGIRSAEAKAVRHGWQTVGVMAGGARLQLAAA